MAKKKVVKEVVLSFTVGDGKNQQKAGMTLGSLGINASELVQKYNEATKTKNNGDVIPAKVIIYDDRSYDLELKTPPAAFLIKKYAKVSKASGKGSKEYVGSITKAELNEIAETKMPDLNAYDLESAAKIVAGTANNMGIKIED